jgi:hypothetical protein
MYLPLKLKVNEFIKIEITKNQNKKDYEIIDRPAQHNMLIRQPN